MDRARAAQLRRHRRQQLSTNLLFDARGNIYGTTAEGGSPGCDCGTIFKLSSDDAGNWTEASCTVSRACRPAPIPHSLVSDGAGHFYGATVHGGEDNDGRSTSSEWDRRFGFGVDPVDRRHDDIPPRR
jgi:uncharacterized repeat protein (TIGR03803 family)